MSAGRLGSTTLAISSVEWRACAPGDHLVQFYEDDGFLIDSTAAFVGNALASGDGVIVIATQFHRDALERRLKTAGCRVAGARKNSQYVTLDAAKTLRKFMVDGTPDEKRFVKVVGGLVKRVAARYPRVQVFGEMVALLWAEGNVKASLRVEQLWNELSRVHAFTLCCAYPINGFPQHVHGAPFLEVCAQHSRVIPAESYLARRTGADQHFRTVAELQQKTNALLTEIDEHKKTQQALEKKLTELAEADRRKDEYLAMLGHELRNPLSPILSALEILRLPDTDAAATRIAHDTIGHQTLHLARLVDDLLDVARISSGKIKLRDELVDLGKVLRRAAEMTRPLIDAKRHRVSVSLPKSSVLVKGDGTRLEQMFGNLLNNAAKYMNCNGEIALIAEIVDAEVAVTIDDKGVGIDAEMLPRIFELFAQADRSLDRSLGGLGVGLWMVRKLAELHGGTVRASSAGLGKGSQFIVRLPLVKLNEAAVEYECGAPAAADACSIRHARRVMVVDDNRDGAELLAILLRMQGHVVQIAHDGHSALQTAVTFSPDVVLLDIGLPGLDGYAVARQLRQMDGKKSQCLIAMTGYGTPEDRKRSREAGFDHHLVKPVEPAQLEEILSGSPVAPMDTPPVVPIDTPGAGRLWPQTLAESARLSIRTH